ncbi:MAG: matrixin family metalloprotease [archaeon]
MRKIFITLICFTLILGFSFAFNPDRGSLEKVKIIHYKDGKKIFEVKPENPGKPQNNSCYSFISKGAKWKTVEDYYINPVNDDALNADFVKNAVDAGITEWEAFGGNIFGNSFLDYNAEFNDAATDNMNTVSFGFDFSPNVIGVTNVWGYFGGKPSTREIVEWDMQLNDQYSWGNAEIDSALMDLQNIATHELGHSAGLADLYNSSCYWETMFGYSSEGETYKRTLNSGDITGIQELYGA